MRLGLVFVLALAMALAGCTESNQSRSAKIAKEAKKGQAAALKRLTIKRRSRDVRVTRSAVLSGDGGTTVVALELRNSGPVQANAPLLFSLYGKGKKRLYRNDEPGLQEALQRIGSIEAGKTIWWVNDQVTGVTGGKRVRVTVGPSEGGKPPAVQLDKGALESDPSGEFLLGSLLNKSNKTLTSVPVYAVGLRAGKVVAAGRAIVQKLNAGARADFRVLLTGNPAGAHFSVYTTPKPVSS
ncbi:MAG TPA: hypothetical protein VNT22_06515 [Baekduia sp.]|nr:hypothetical protein [Baekduia sp.]